MKKRRPRARGSPAPKAEVARLEERVRTLERELAEAHERETATAEILRAISRSPTGLQPVLDVLVESAAKFCGADDATIQRLVDDHLPVVAHYGPIPSPTHFAPPFVRGATVGRALIERRIVHVPDLQAETEEFPEGSAVARQIGYHTILTAPLIRDGTPLGTLALRRLPVAPFSDKQIALLRTFADQAVIAIENVRLFKELEARNRDLTDALARQTATAEVLRVISRSQTDIQPVFAAILDCAVRLCAADLGGIFVVEDGRARSDRVHAEYPREPGR